MREIKFRAWDKRRGKFQWGISNICLTLGGNLMWQSGFNVPDILSSEEANDYILMQFTGLHDKNGKEIYEGDIVQWNKPVGSKAEVKFGLWDNGELYEAREEGYGWYCTFDYTYLTRRGKEHKRTQTQSLHNQNIEVIGNIYENPELLGGG
jgi:uncharacterized phage protein (TIGR01671 family)